MNSPEVTPRQVIAAEEHRPQRVPSLMEAAEIGRDDGPSAVLPDIYPQHYELLKLRSQTSREALRMVLAFGFCEQDAGHYFTRTQYRLH